MNGYKYKTIKNVKEEVTKLIKGFPNFPQDVEIVSAEIVVNKEGKQYLLISFFKNDILDYFFHEMTNNLESIIKNALEYIKDYHEMQDIEMIEEEQEE